MPKEPEMAAMRDSYVAFFFSWNQVATKGRENANEAPPTRIRNSRALFLVWNGMFCLCIDRKEVVTLNNAHHGEREMKRLTFPGAFSISPLNGRDLVRERRE